MSWLPWYPCTRCLLQLFLQKNIISAKKNPVDPVNPAPRGGARIRIRLIRIRIHPIEHAQIMWIWLIWIQIRPIERSLCVIFAKVEKVAKLNKMAAESDSARGTSENGYWIRKTLGCGKKFVFRTKKVGKYVIHNIQAWQTKKYNTLTKSFVLMTSSGGGKAAIIRQKKKRATGQGMQRGIRCRATGQGMQ